MFSHVSFASSIHFRLRPYPDPLRKLLSCDHDHILRAHYEIAIALANAFANVFALVNAFAIVLANCDCACDDTLGHHTLALWKHEHRDIVSLAGIHFFVLLTVSKVHGLYSFYPVFILSVFIISGFIQSHSLYCFVQLHLYDCLYRRSSEEFYVQVVFHRLNNNVFPNVI